MTSPDQTEFANLEKLQITVELSNYSSVIQVRNMSL